MKKIELLAPAGDKESLIAAVQNGADAIYLVHVLLQKVLMMNNYNGQYNTLIYMMSKSMLL